MPANRSVEIGTGLFVVLGFAALGFLSTQLPGSKLSVGSTRTPSTSPRGSTTSATCEWAHR